MRQCNRRGSLFSLSMLFVVGLLTTGAHAQVQITSPTEGENVRGEIMVRFEGVPNGGYAMVYLDGKWQFAVSRNSFSLNTFPPNFPGDGPHTIKVVAIGAGRSVGEDEVTFNIANNVIETGDPGVRLTVWKPEDMITQQVHRYLIFAESSATIEDGKEAGGAQGGGDVGGGAGGRGGRGGSSDTKAKTIEAPLDFQVSALLRRIIRDVGMLDNSANIQTVVQRAFQRQREDPTAKEGSTTGGSTGPRRRQKASGGPTTPSEPSKAPWGEWEPAQEVGQYFVKTIKQSGEEVNGTRKSPTIALTDLLPRFPNAVVRPGSTWESPMTFITELSTRQPLNVQAPITFTKYDTLTTPLGRVRRVAKLEARFRLPEDVAFGIAETLAARIGAGSAGGGAGGAEGGGGAEGAGAAAGGARPGSGGGAAAGGPGGGAEGGAGGGSGGEVEITVARSTVTRVLWFDIENKRVLRSEDIVDTYFEQEAPEQEEAEEDAEGTTGATDTTRAGGRGMGDAAGRPRGGRPGGAGAGGAGAGGAGAGGAGQAPAEPTKVTYNLHVTTWLDDSVPPPTDVYNAGAGTAHARDNAQDPTLDRIMRPTP